MSIKRLHEHGYTFTEKATIESLTPRQRALLDLADVAEAYVKQEQRKRQQSAADTQDRPENFGDVHESRREAFE